jgi:hypothetical protein
MSHEALRKECVRAAKGRAVVTYTDVAPYVGLNMSVPDDRKKIGDILTELASAEHEAGRPLLSAVVVLSSGGAPGAGFFKLARALGLMEPKENKKAFLWNELNRVWNYWSTQ